ncbi:hypothetical protein HY622_02980 [Candidatus Uhrbacteria bacterium]|nr:hypothetical protein [Candidatus Uhrbacteria bacterium]
MTYPTFSFDEETTNDPELSFDEVLGQEVSLPEEYSAEDIKVEEQPASAQGYGEAQPEIESALSDIPLFEEEQLPLADHSMHPEPSLAVVKEQISHQDAAQLSQSRLILLKKELSDIRSRIDRALELVEAQLPQVKRKDDDDQEEFIRKIDTLLVRQEKENGKSVSSDSERIIEGVFDGQHMVGADGNQYAVPPNYASKSKLVEGDTLKLTITDAGSFLYKQIGPVERVRLVGTLNADANHESYSVNLGDRSWRVLTACVTYFRGAPGDEVVFLVPKDSACSWAAVENIIKRA